MDTGMPEGQAPVRPASPLQHIVRHDKAHQHADDDHPLNLATTASPPRG
jgi:hypothetical protein